jgi:hypothetical protein
MELVGLMCQQPARRPAQVSRVPFSSKRRCCVAAKKKAKAKVAKKKVAKKRKK